MRDLLARYPTPTALRATGRSRVRNLVARRSPRLANKVTNAVFDALDAQTLTLPAEDTWGQVIIELAGDLDRIWTRRAELAKQIEEVFLQHPLATVLVSLCGFGPRTGARTLELWSRPPTRTRTPSRRINPPLHPAHPRSAGKDHNAAIICLARRRCDLILAMLKTRTPYRQPAGTPPKNRPSAA